MTRPTYRRLSDRERWFLENHGHRVKVQHLAEVLNRSEVSAKRLKDRLGSRPVRATVSLSTAKEIFRHGGVLPDLRFSYGGLLLPSGFWEEWQVTDLKCRIGCESVKEIAKDLGRSQVATRCKALREGLDPTKYTIRRLANLLIIPLVTVAGWTEGKSGRNGGYRVRRYKEGRFTVVHRNDAEWLLDNRDLARRDEFEDHPGKLHEIKDGE